MRGVCLEQFGHRPDDRYRTISEACLIDTLLLPGWAFEVAAGQREAAEAGAAAALAGWIALGLGYRRSGTDRLFDPAEVVNFFKWAGLAGRDRFWIDRFVATHRAHAATFAAAGPAARFAVALRRRFDLRHFARGARLRLRLPLPLAGPYLSEIAITPVVPPGLQGVCADGRMEVRLAAGDDPVVEIGADLAFTAHPPPGPAAAHCLAPEEAELYLRPAEGLIRISPRIAALADKLAGSNLPLAALTSFWAFLLDELVCGMVQYDQVPPDAAGDWVLERRCYDCQLGAALFVSLCRARGIPARLLGGHLLYRLLPTNHFWAEAWLDGCGWMPFDFLTWDLSAGGTDPAWRNHFFAAVDFRMVTQCLPLAHTGPMSIRFPPSWHMIQTAFGDGARMTFSACDGTPIYSDTLTALAVRKAGKGSAPF